MIGLVVPPIAKQFSDPAKGLVVMTSGCWWVYILPALIAAAGLMFLPDWILRRTGKNWFMTVYLLGALFLAGLILPLNDFLSPYRSALVAKEAIAAHVPQNHLLYQYRENFYGIDFYNKIRTPIVEDFGELGDGIAKMPEAERKKYFLSRVEFFDKAQSEKEIYCITQHRDKLRELQAKLSGIDILWSNGAFYLLRIRQVIKDE
jgi:hypothetical protein